MIHFRHTLYPFYGDPIGPLAMIICESGQARKGAAAADVSCAEMWLLGSPPFSRHRVNLSQNAVPAFT